MEVEAAQRLVSLVAPSVKTYADHEQNLLVLFGLTSDLDVASKILTQYDQKTFSAQQQTVETSEAGEALTTNAVAVFYADGKEMVELVRRRWPLRDFAWDEQTEHIVGQATAEEWAQIRVFVVENDLPNFILKGGLLNAQGEARALVEYKDITTLVKTGDELHGWKISEIGADQVELDLDGRKLIIRMGR